MSPLEEIGTSRHSIPSDTAQGSLPVASYDGQQLASVAAAHIAVLNAAQFLNARSTADVSVVTTTEPSPVLQLPLAPASSLAESDGMLRPHIFEYCFLFTVYVVICTDGLLGLDSWGISQRPRSEMHNQTP